MAGSKVTIVMDHKQLLCVFGNMPSGLVRSNRIKLRHKGISFNLVWMKGSHNPADYLSRRGTPVNRLPKAQREETTEFEKTVWFLQYAPYTEAISFCKMIKGTDRDTQLSSLKKCIRKGHIPKADKSLAPFRKVFTELTISDEKLVLKGEKIVLPTSLHKVAIDR